jgi:hypothetical protein
MAQARRYDVALAAAVAKADVPPTKAEVRGVRASSLPSPVSPGLRVGLGTHAAPDGRHRNGGARPNAGRPKGSPNKITSTFRDVLLQAVSEVGDSQEVKQVNDQRVDLSEHLVAICCPVI